CELGAPEFASVRSPVGCLFLARRPPNISAHVTLVVVDAVERFAVWPSAYVAVPIHEVAEIKIVEGKPATAVVAITFVVSVENALLHGAPDRVFWSPPHSVLGRTLC